jgi:hypothetical protein
MAVEKLDSVRADRRADLVGSDPGDTFADWH